MRRRLLSGILLVLVVTACHSSPTEPASGACATDFIATLTNTNGAATLIKVQLVLDGQVFDVPDQPAAPVAAFKIGDGL